MGYYNYDEPGFTDWDIEEAFRKAFQGRSSHSNLVFIDVATFNDYLRDVSDYVQDDAFMVNYIDDNHSKLADRCRNCFGVSQWEWV